MGRSPRGGAAWAALVLALANLSGLAAAGCAAPHTRPGPLYPGRADASPSMECLPDPDVTDDTFTLHMQRGRELAQASFEVAVPALPSDHSARALTDWADGPLRTWLQQKTHAVEAARQELDLAAEENHRQRIIGGALVGLMHEDIARVLASVPSPDDLATEPEIEQAFRHVIEGQAHPYFELARQAYRACALNAVQPASMEHWSHFCRERMDHLPGADDIESTPSDTTSVEVMHD
jgi:hypothetical protein